MNYNLYLQRVSLQAAAMLHRHVSTGTLTNLAPMRANHVFRFSEWPLEIALVGRQ